LDSARSANGKMSFKQQCPPWKHEKRELKKLRLLETIEHLQTLS